MIRKQLYRYINLKAMVLSLPGAPIEEGSGKGKKIRRKNKYLNQDLQDYRITMIYESKQSGCFSHCPLLP
jgi:hypothetical protein